MEKNEPQRSLLPALGPEDQQPRRKVALSSGENLHGSREKFLDSNSYRLPSKKKKKKVESLEIAARLLHDPSPQLKSPA